MRHILAATVATAALIAGEAGAQSESARLESLEAQVRELSRMLEQTTQELQALREQQTKTEERVSTVVADDDEPLISTEEDGWKLTLAARINQAILYADQGGDASEAFIVDNDASGSRLEFLAEKTWGDWASGLEIVVSAEVNSTDAIDFGETDDSADENDSLGEFRQAHWYIENPAYGYFSIGQGDTAAEDTAHVDLSGTDFAGAGSDVDDIAGGLTFFDEDGEATAELDDFFDMQDGSRALRALYKTPDYYGFALKASASNDAQSLEDDDDIDGDGLEPQIGFEYAATFADYEVEAGGSWRLEDQVGDDVPFLVGSASVLAPVGVSLTLAGSVGLQEATENSTALFGKVGRLPRRLLRGRRDALFARRLPRAQRGGFRPRRTARCPRRCHTASSPCRRSTRSAPSSMPAPGSTRSTRSTAMAWRWMSTASSPSSRAPASASDGGQVNRTISAWTQRLVLLAGVLCLLAGCAHYAPKEFTADDRCKGCPSGGIFTGEDGVLSHEF